MQDTHVQIFYSYIKISLLYKSIGWAANSAFSTNGDICEFNWNLKMLHISYYCDNSWQIGSPHQTMRWCSINFTSQLYWLYAESMLTLVAGGGATLLQHRINMFQNYFEIGHTYITTKHKGLRSLSIRMTLFITTPEWSPLHASSHVMYLAFHSMMHHIVCLWFQILRKKNF